MKNALIWAILETLVGFYFFYKQFQQKKKYFFIFGIIFLCFGIAGILNVFYENLIIYKYAFAIIEIIIGGFFFILFFQKRKKIDLLSASLLSILGIERIFALEFFGWIFLPYFWSILHIITGLILLKAFEKYKNNVYLISSFILFILSIQLLIF